jgi:hypothetical protein
MTFITLVGKTCKAEVIGAMKIRWRGRRKSGGDTYGCSGK